MIRLLLLTAADTGSGHIAVGTALAQAAAARADELTAATLDALAPRYPRWSDHLAHLYNPIIVRTPWLWHTIYSLTNGPQAPVIYRTLAGQSVTRRVAEAAEAHRPDVIVAVHPLLTQSAVAARRRSEVAGRALVVTVITDLVDVHRIWVAEGIDHYVVGTEAAAAAVMRYGVPPQRISRYGIPLRPAFGALDVPMVEMRRRLELDPDLPLVLVMGGGAGAGDLVARVRAMAEMARRGRKFQIAVVTGRNLESRLALESRSWPLPVRTYGQTDQVAELMTAADIVATKPGSVTVCEALAVGRPVILGRSVGGQEDGNIPYIVKGEAGFYAPSHREAADAVDLLLAQPEVRWAMGQNAARLGRRDAADRTLDLAQGLVIARGPHPPAPSPFDSEGELRPRRR